MTTKNYLFFAILFSLAISLAAQEQPLIRVYISDDTQVVDGQKYYLHTVEKGQTLFALSVAYNVSVEKIAEVNNLTDNIIGLGEVLKIPFVTEVPVEVPPVDTTLYHIHKVERGETFFSISQQYGVEIETIKEINPEVADGLQAGATILLPKDKEAIKKIEEDYTLEEEKAEALEEEPKDYFIHVVQRRETLYSISNKYLVPIQDIVRLNPGADEGISFRQELKIPKHGHITSEMDFVEVYVPETIVADTGEYVGSVICKPLEKKREIKMALLLPLFLNEVENISTNFAGVQYQRQSTQRIAPFVFLPFYQGFKLALDSLAKAGMKARLYVYDIGNDELQAQAFTMRQEMKDLDMIIGPFHPSSFKIISQFAKANNISHINPFVTTANVLKSNGNLINIALTANIQIEQFVRHLKNNHRDKNIILVHNNTANEKNILNIFQNHWRYINRGDTLFNFIEVPFNVSRLTGVSRNIRKDKENLVICINTNEAFVSDFIRLLSTLQDDDEPHISLYGLPSWQNYNNLELAYLEKLQYRYFSTTYINYKDSATTEFIKKFRDTYAMEPDDYAFLGYDTGLYFAYAFQNFGKVFTECINEIPVTPLRSGFTFRFNNTSQTYDNVYLNFLRYIDYTVVKE